MTILLNKPFQPCLKTLSEYLKLVNESGWYSNFGKLHEELTSKLESYLGVSNLLLVSNGTLAIQVACKTFGVKTALSTPFSFSATSSALMWQGIDISYSDIDNRTLNICPKKLAQRMESSNDFDAIVATHVYGNPCDVDSLSVLANGNNIKLIYDAAHAFSVMCGEKSVLSYGDASTLSFHATKLFHTLEGGAIIFREKHDYLKAKELINFGLDSAGKLVGPGINGKLNEYQCAVGLTNLSHVDTILEVRRELFSTYVKELKNTVEIPLWNSRGNFNGAYMPILLKDEKEKIKVKNNLIDNNIQCREYFSPSLNTIFKPEEQMPVSELAAKRILCLPLHFYMTCHDVLTVSNTVKRSLL
ncbi:DegT/DnrJ/EryC1/StrS family aminotransferase [Luminiphilus sp.]|nr:DegT/DnrJ/EryC1/StrS family aminotransferase [Luminiphilus sp.]